MLTNEIARVAVDYVVYLKNIFVLISYLLK